MGNLQDGYLSLAWKTSAKNSKSLMQPQVAYHWNTQRLEIIISHVHKSCHVDLHIQSHK